MKRFNPHLFQIDVVTFHLFSLKKTIVFTFFYFNFYCLFIFLKNSISTKSISTLFVASVSFFLSISGIQLEMTDYKPCCSSLTSSNLTKPKL